MYGNFVCIVYFASDKVFIKEFYYYYYYYNLRYVISSQSCSQLII